MFNWDRIPVHIILWLIYLRNIPLFACSKSRQVKAFKHMSSSTRSLIKITYCLKFYVQRETVIKIFKQWQQSDLIYLYFWTRWWINFNCTLCFPQNIFFVLIHFHLFKLVPIFVGLGKVKFCGYFISGICKSLHTRV